MKKKLLFSLAIFPAVGFTAAAVYGFISGLTLEGVLTDNYNSNMAYSRDFSL